jgi:uncharacterized membrane protein YeaQ/YmgE (transglycosylase-associated protein family)
MTLSAYLISLAFASVLGLLFHVIVGGRGWRIIFFVLCSWVGFFIGNILGTALGWKWMNVGPIHLIPAILGAIGIMLLGRWLGKVQKNP